MALLIQEKLHLNTDYMIKVDKTHNDSTVEDETKYIHYMIIIHYILVNTISFFFSNGYI